MEVEVLAIRPAGSEGKTVHPMQRGDDLARIGYDELSGLSAGGQRFPDCANCDLISLMRLATSR